jgi:hypothetical protein
MSALDNLAPDQRAVLQMVLQRGRSYDEIAALLSIERAAVRQRALDAFDSLAPATVLPGPESALITDYLLRQLPEKVAEQVYSYLQASDTDRAWAEAVSSVLAPLAPGSLPEIPVGAPLGADDWPAGGLEQDSDPPLPSGEEPPAAPAEDYYEPQPAPGPATGPAQPSEDDAWTDEGQEPSSAQRELTPRERRPSSRRGGAILLGTIAVLVIAAVVVVVATSGGGKNSPVSSGHTTSGTTSTPTSSITVTTATTTTGTDEPLAQLNLTSPTGASSTAGIVQVERVDGVIGMVIYAQGVPANTAHNAYAVWLYNSPTSYKFVGFVPNLVGKTGKLSTEGGLPTGATKYRRILITLETQQKPSTPGEVVLSGPFRE